MRINGRTIDMDRRSIPRRALILAFCVLFAAVSLYSANFVLVNSSHTHECGEHSAKDVCDVCARLTAALSMLKFFAPAAAKTLSVFSILLFAAFALKSVCFHIVFLTPVRLKVRLNN